MSPALDPRALYDGTAERWRRTEPQSLSDFTARPAVLALCEPVAGSRVLDLGCGEGYCARKLLSAGAAEIVGIDVSPRMIDAAIAALPADPSVRFEVGDATRLDHLEPDRFDLVVAVFLYNYLGIEDTARSFAEVRRVLRPGGRFVMAVPHPSLPFSGAPEAPPFYFAAGGRDYFGARDQRLPGAIWRRDGVRLDVQMVHKTIEDYVTALGAAGFESMPRVRELHVTGEHMALDPEFFAPLRGYPLHMAMVLR